MKRPERVMTGAQASAGQEGSQVEARLKAYRALTADLDAIARHARDPALMAMLTHALAKEREKTNQILERMEQKFDDILFLLREQAKTPASETVPARQAQAAEFLAEADEKILALVEKQGQATAHDVQKALAYRGLNAASQRLNKLFREGYLRKVRVGRKVVYLPRN